MLNVTESVNNVLQKAGEIAFKYSCKEIGSEHILYGLTANETCIASQILLEFGVTSFKVEEVFRKNYMINNSNKLTEIPLTPRSYKIMQSAENISAKLNVGYVGTEHVLLSLLFKDDCLAVQILSQVCSVDISALKTRIAVVLRLVSAQELQEVKKTKMRAVASRQQKVAMQEKTEKNEEILALPTKNKNGISEEMLSMGEDLNLKAESGKIDPVIGRDKEIERIIEVLCRKTKRNPILVGEAGVGKSAIVEGLALKIVNKEVPDILKNKVIYSLEVGSLLAGSKYRGSMEEKFKKIIKELRDNPNIILFIDELHTIIQASGGEGEVGPAEMLKPYLSRGELQTIGATTFEEYRRFIEKDKALERRFETVVVNAPSMADSIKILYGIKSGYEKFHNVVISDSAIISAVKLSERYIPDRNLPDKAIDIIDEACAKAKVEASKSGVIQITRIDESEICDVISCWTQIPVAKLTQKENEKLQNLDNVLETRVIGQNQAVTSVSKAIKRARVGLKDDKRPIGSFIFLGQTGVGKTELCKALSEALFGSENQMIRFDMSEYMEAFSVSKLIGAPAGYAGYEDAGLLTKQVKKKPYSLVLFDEIEKAHPDVFNILLQILEDGRLTDNQGKTVSFKNTIIIFTSNCGVNELPKFDKKVNFFDFSKESEQYKKEAENILLTSLKKKFKPEFLNRIDCITVFNPLSEKDFAMIATKMIKNLNDRLQAVGLCIKLTEDALKYIVHNGSSLEYGARPLRRLITNKIEDIITEDIMTGKTASYSQVKVDCDGEKLVFNYR